MIEGYAYALVIDGQEIKPWITGKDGALREVNLQRFVRVHEHEADTLVRSAQIIDQRIRRVAVQFPATRVYTDGEVVIHG